jgi:hypothetical protein
MLAERTYRSSPGLIALYGGSIGATSFLLQWMIQSTNEVPVYLRLFAPVIALPIVSIVLEVIFQKKAYNMLHAVAEQRLALLRELGNDEITNLVESPPKNMKELQDYTDAFFTRESDGFTKIRREAEAAESRLAWLRRWGILLFLCTLGFLVFVVVERVGFFGALLNLLCLN